MHAHVYSFATATALAGLIGLSGCADEEAKASAEPAQTASPKAAEKPTTATATTAASSLAGAGGDYDVDSSHTQVVFRVDHFGVSRQLGRFNKTTGSITIDEAVPSNSTVKLEIATASVFTADKKRDTHLRSPDFFDAKQFPVISFESTAVEPSGGAMYDVTGTLSMHGVTRTITIPLEHVGSGDDPWGGFRSGFYATFSLDRSDYGMKHMLDAIGDEITLMVSIEATRK